MYPGNLFRPFTSFFHASLALLFGAQPFAFIISNILLHALVSIFVFRFLQHLVPTRTALFIALVFSAHPLHIEAVANATGKAELLASLFVLIFLDLAIANERRVTANALLLFLSAFLAFASKESSLTLLLLYPLCCWFFKVSLRSLPIAALLLAAISYTSLRLQALGSLFGAVSEISFVDNPLVALSEGERAIEAILLLGKYLRLMLLPYPLSADYSYNHLTLPVENGGFYAGFVTALLLLFVFSLKRCRIAGFFAGWFFLSFAITSNVAFSIGTIFGERLAYLPSLAVCGLVVVVVQRALAKPFSAFVLSALVASGAVYCNLGSMWWKSQESLFERQIAESPNSLKTLVNYSVVMRNQSKFLEAERVLVKSLAIQNDYYEATFALSSLYVSLNEIGKAKHYLLRTLKLNSNHIPALELAGRLAFNQGEYKQARSYLERALEINKNHTGSLSALTAVALGEARLAEAQALLAAVSTHSAASPEELRMLEAELDRLKNTTISNN